MLRQQHVVGLDIAVDLGLLIHEVEAFQHGFSDRGNLHLRQGLSCHNHDVVDAAKRAILHDDLRCAKSNRAIRDQKVRRAKNRVIGKSDDYDIMPDL